MARKAAALKATAPEAAAPTSPLEVPDKFKTGPGYSGSPRNEQGGLF